MLKNKECSIENMLVNFYFMDSYIFKLHEKVVRSENNQENDNSYNFPHILEKHIFKFSHKFEEK